MIAKAWTWVVANWPWIVGVLLPILISIINRVTEHYSSKTGLVKFLGFLAEIFSVLSSKDVQPALKLPFTSRPPGSGEPPVPPVAVLLMIVAIASSGCGLLRKPTTPRSLPQVKAVELWDQAKCEKVQNRKNWLVGIDAALAFLSGGSGIAAAFPELEKYRLAAAIPSLVLGIGAAVMAPFVANATKDYADHCVEGGQ